MKKVQTRETSRSIAKAGSRRGLRKTRWRPAMESLEVRQVPTTFSVNTALDTVAANLQTGQDAAGHISLRSAIMAANAHAGADTITLPAGIFGITIAGTNEVGDLRGDLNIKGDVTIEGLDSLDTVVDGNNLDRVFEVLSGKVTISGMTIRDGRSGQGGGLLNDGGQVTLSSVAFRNNTAIGTNGANGADGIAGVPGRPFVAPTNGQNGGSAAGGAIYNAIGSVALVNNTVAGNFATGGQGGMGGAGIGGVGANGTTSFTRGVPDGHQINGGAGAAGGAGGSAQGGGVFNATGATLTITGTTFTDDVARGGAGGQGGAGGTVTGGAGATAEPVGEETEGMGGMGIGGTGGAGGAAGAGEGGAIYNSGQVSLVPASTPSVMNNFLFNSAIGGAGGAGGPGGAGLGGRGGNGAGVSGGGFGGAGFGGTGGTGNAGGIGFGGAIYDTAVASAASSGPVQFSGNLASGGAGGKGGAGFIGVGGDGGNGISILGGGFGGGGKGGQAGAGGQGEGGGFYNVLDSKMSITGSASNTSSETVAFFDQNEAVGGVGGVAGAGGLGQGGFGTNATPSGNSGIKSQGGFGGSAQGGAGGLGGTGGLAEGGSFYNSGTVTIAGITLQAFNSEALPGEGGAGGIGGFAQGGAGGTGDFISRGGDATGGNGGVGGNAGSGFGGFFFNTALGSVTIDPRLGAPAGSAQSKATNVIKANTAFINIGGAGGLGGGANPGGPAGHTGTAKAGSIASEGGIGQAIAGGLYLAPGGNVTLRNATVTGNTDASSTPNIFGKFSS